MYTETTLLLPLILISTLSIVAIVLDALFLKNKKIGSIFSVAALIVVAVSAASNIVLNTVGLPQEMIAAGQSRPLPLSQGMLRFNYYSYFFDVLFCVAGILAILASPQFLRRAYKELNEYYSLILLSISGMLLIAHSDNMLILFIGIEIMSIAFYVLAGYFRNDALSNEAAIKYFLLGSFSTGFLVYGMALIYGATGTLGFSGIHGTITLNTSYSVPILNIGIGLVFVGLFFKIAAFPFHQWAPDVYSGSPTVVTAFMSTAGKAAAIMALVTISKITIGEVDTQWLYSKSANYETLRMIVACIAAATMLVGNLSALVQKNIKRMLAYSSVAHAGYLLMGIVAHNELGYAGIGFYASAYIFMQIGAFVIVSIFENHNGSNLNISDYAGLSKKSPAMAAMLAIFMFSLAGIPPFAGFFGKYYLFFTTIKAGYTWLTIVAVIASLISMYYYIGLIIQMYFKDSDSALVAEKNMAWLPVVISTAIIILLGVFPSYLIDLLTKCFAFF